MVKKNAPASMIVVFGDDDHQKATALTRILNTLLPPAVDRSLALSVYDAGQKPEQDGPTLAGVMEDLHTLPFLSDRRVVLIRSADDFLGAAENREALEKFAASPAPTGTLVLECRSFPKNLRLHKATVAGGGEIHECRKLRGSDLIRFARDEAVARDKTLSRQAAEQLVELVGQESGGVAAEVEKLALYVGDRHEITPQDVAALVGQSREEMIFAAMDAAALGKLDEALRLWQNTLTTDRDAIYKAAGGMAFKLRQWLAVHQMRADGAATRALLGKAGMWGRERDLETLLRRQPAGRLRRALAAVAELDAQAKSGVRSIERGVEHLLVRLSGVAR